jgi:protein TonB
MFDRLDRPRFDPRSPVQPGRNPAPYLLVAVVAAFALWIALQNWTLGSNENSAKESIQTNGKNAGPEVARSAKGDVRAIFTADDYPLSSQANGEEGTVQARLTVDTNGRVSRCDIVRSSGHQTLDDTTCNILEKRARFVPARNSDGRPISSTVVTPPVTWKLEG